MIVVNKGNFFVRTVQKRYGSASADKNAFYTDFRICLALEGEAVWEIEDRTYFIQPGDIVLLKVGQKRQFTSFGKNGFKLCAFVLGRNAFSGLHHFTYFTECIRRQENVIKNSSLSSILKELYEEWEQNSYLRYELASAKLTEFFVQAERASNTLPLLLSPGQKEMLEMIDYIDSNITQGISLSAAAKKAGMTESSFSRRFSAVNGISFKKYVVEKKIQLAILLLRTTNKKIIDIALDSGFDSMSGFYDAFKRKTGTTPSKFTEYEI